MAVMLDVMFVCVGIQCSDEVCVESEMLDVVYLFFFSTCVFVCCRYDDGHVVIKVSSESTAAPSAPSYILSGSQSYKRV